MPVIEKCGDLRGISSAYELTAPAENLSRVELLLALSEIKSRAKGWARDLSRPLYRDSLDISLHVGLEAYVGFLVEPLYDDGYLGEAQICRWERLAANGRLDADPRVLYFARAVGERVRRRVDAARVAGRAVSEVADIPMEQMRLTAWDGRGPVIVEHEGAYYIAATPEQVRLRVGRTVRQVATEHGRIVGVEGDEILEHRTRFERLPCSYRELLDYVEGHATELPQDCQTEAVFGLLCRGLTDQVAPLGLGADQSIVLEVAGQLSFME